MDRGEAELELLLREVDEAAGRDGGADESLEIYWEAWEALPWYIRDWLLATAPGWWALSAGAFRRLLLITSGLIIWDRMHPAAALRRAGQRLSLPPPRRDVTRLRRALPPTTARPGITQPRFARRSAYGWRAPSIAAYRRRLTAPRGYVRPARRWARPAARGFGRVRRWGLRR
jgi:hypothetical protein